MQAHLQGFFCVRVVDGMAEHAVCRTPSASVCLQQLHQSVIVIIIIIIIIIAEELCIWIVCEERTFRFSARFLRLSVASLCYFHTMIPLSTLSIHNLISRIEALYHTEKKKPVYEYFSS
jgi:hypothetical protein